MIVLTLPSNTHMRDETPEEIACDGAEGRYITLVQAGGVMGGVHFGLCEVEIWGTVGCAPCPKGTFSDADGSSSCTVCPEGAFSGFGSTSCGACSPGEIEMGGGTLPPVPVTALHTATLTLSCLVCSVRSLRCRSV